MTKHGGGGGAGEIRSAPRLPIILNFLARKQKQEARNNGGFPPAADERVGGIRICDDEACYLSNF
jgi:hypothetical protein